MKRPPIRFVSPTWFLVVSFLSAYLLFSLEPLIAKLILPWFGGSAAVWSTCLVFYQVDLLLGTLYAHWLIRLASPRRQTAVHVGVLLVSLGFLPIGPSIMWRETANAHPSALIFLMLFATVGLPFLALSATNSLLQAGYARVWAGRQPFWIFAISNGASLAGLLAYPLVVEPTLDIGTQRAWWSVFYILFALSIGGLLYQIRGLEAIDQEPARVPDIRDSARTAGVPLRWFAFSACGSALLLSVTNHIAANVAAVPLLWVLPLATYLISFIFAFAKRPAYNRTLWLRLLAAALGFMAYAIYDINAVEPLQISLPIFLAGLFVGCMFCHSELVRISPRRERLTEFYLMIACGGAAGGMFVGLICPVLFSGVYELPLTLLIVAALGLTAVWESGKWPVRLIWAAISVAMATVLAANVEAFRAGSLSLRRSFYGSLRVVQSPLAGPKQTRTLFHGTIEHGSQFLLPPARRRPTAYYGPDSGIGIVLREGFDSSKRVGMVGLGVGTIAAYGKAGDTFRFYEINRQDIDLAGSLFFYLRESAAAIEIVEGDGRLALEKDRAPAFDVLALDAFSGDAVPVHLLTREAFRLYERHLKPKGVLAFHVSNDFLDLAAVVRDLASDAHWGAVLVRSHQDEDTGELPADWVIVSRDAAVLQNASLQVHAIPFSGRPHSPVWTDAYNNLWEILKTPALR